jgi:hypothetical protein
MISKTELRDAVAALLCMEAEAQLLRALPDVYYGWVPPTDEVPGHWLGEADERQAQYQLDLAQVAYKAAAERTWSDSENEDLQQALRLAEAARDAARATLDEVRTHRDRLVDAYRTQVLNRRVASLFLKTYRKAIALDWNLYHPAIPESLRAYAQRQLARGPLSPVSVVFLYLSVQSTIEHGEEFQTEAITGYDYLVDNPLATCLLNIDVPEDGSERALRRAYVKELQAKAIRDRRADAHENKDPRDVLADFEYHGLPEQLGAMWISKDENCCSHCKQGVRVRMIHSGGGYRYATVCPNFQDDPQCHYEIESPEFSSRKALRSWAMEQVATEQAA